jgi:hypothetical protein
MKLLKQDETGQYNVVPGQGLEVGRFIGIDSTPFEVKAIESEVLTLLPPFAYNKEKEMVAGPPEVPFKQGQMFNIGQVPFEVLEATINELVLRPHGYKFQMPPTKNQRKRSRKRKH